MQFFRQVKNLSCYIRGWNRCTFKISWIQQNTIQSECFSKSNVFLGEDPLLQRCYHMDLGEMDHAVLVDITGSIVLVSFLEVMSLQLIWRSGNHLQVPHLQMSCRDLLIMRGNQDDDSSNDHQSNIPYLYDPRFTQTLLHLTIALFWKGCNTMTTNMSCKNYCLVLTIIILFINLRAVTIKQICPKSPLLFNLDKSLQLITTFSVVQSFWNFAQNMAVSLPCSVQNLKMIGQPK